MFLLLVIVDISCYSFTGCHKLTIASTSSNKAIVWASDLYTFAKRDGFLLHILALVALVLWSSHREVQRWCFH